MPVRHLLFINDEKTSLQKMRKNILQRVHGNEINHTILSNRCVGGQRKSLQPVLQLHQSFRKHRIPHESFRATAIQHAERMQKVDKSEQSTARSHTKDSQKNAALQVLQTRKNTTQNQARGTLCGTGCGVEN